MDFRRYVKSSTERDPGSSLLLLFGYLCLAFVLASLLQLGVVILSTIIKSGGSFNVENLLGAASALAPTPNNWWLLVILQGLSSIILFIGTAWFYWVKTEKKPFSTFNSNPIPAPNFFLVVFVLQLLFLPFNSYLGSINEAIQLPAFLSKLEQAMKAMEQSAAELTEFLAKTTSISQLLANILVIGVIAGIGEELLFRGLIQRKFIRWFKNYHIAVWLAAFIFSAIHFQFYGFFPRAVLGAFFGYLYVWSGHIAVPIAAHIFNNSLAVLIFHFINKGMISPELEKMDNIPFIWVSIATFVFTGLLFMVYRQLIQEKKFLA